MMKSKKPKPAHNPALLHKLFESKPTKGEQRRYELVQAAFHCLDKHGFESFTFDLVGKEAGLKPSHVAYYFPTKQHLLVAVFRLLVAELQEGYVEALTSLRDPLEMLEAYLKVTFDSVEQRSGFRSMVPLLFYFATRDAEIRDIYLSSKRAGIARVEAIVEQFPKLAGAKKLVLEALAERIISETHGRVLQYVIHSEPAYSASLRHDSAQKAKKLFKTGVWE